VAKLKKGPGRLIGRWKEEAVAANPGASDEDLARAVNETARKQGYAYTITPDKVRTGKKAKKKVRKPAPAAARTTPAPAKAVASGGISLARIIRASGTVRGLERCKTLGNPHFCRRWASVRTEQAAKPRQAPRASRAGADLRGIRPHRPSLHGLTICWTAPLRGPRHIASKPFETNGANSQAASSWVAA
jgi:hypothetical protein